MAKSKMPDFGEVSKMAGKLFGDLKKSVTEIIDDYKSERKETEASKPPTEAPTNDKKEDKE